MLQCRNLYDCNECAAFYSCSVVYLNNLIYSMFISLYSTSRKLFYLMSTWQYGINLTDDNSQKVLKIDVSLCNNNIIYLLTETLFDFKQY